jgi:hypothetical protein
MAEAINGSAVSKAIPQSNTLSQARESLLRLSLTGLTAIDDRAIVFGSAAAPPATYAGIHNPSQQRLTESDTASIRYDPVSGQDLTLSLSLGLGTMGGMVVGEHLYACVFPTYPASGTDVPDLVVDLGVMSA